MPVTLVDPTVQAQGSLPASPLSAMMAQMVGAYGRQFPTALERSEMNYKNAATTQLQQQNGAPQELQDLAAKMYAIPGATANSGAIAPSDGSVAAPAPNRDDMVRNNLPALFGTLARAGQYSNLGNVTRALVANAPGVTYNSGDMNHPSPVSAAMVGSGESPLNTPEALTTGMTPEQRNRNLNINRIMQTQKVDYATAEGLTDGVFDLTTDQAGNRVLVNKANGNAHLLFSPQPNTIAGGPAKTAPATGSAGTSPTLLPNGQRDDALTIFGDNEGHDLPSTNAAPEAVGSKGTETFAMKPGDLGIDFNGLYGGGAVAQRGGHALSSITGGNTADPALAAFSNLNNLKSGLVNAMSLMPGRSSNATTMHQLLESVPDTTSDVAEDEGGTAFNQARINPADAETKFNQLINQAAAVRNEAYNAPYLDPKVRDTYMTAIHGIDTTLKNALPAATYARYAASSPGSPAPDAPATNLEKGTQATSMPKAGKDGMITVTGPDGNPYRIPPSSLQSLLKAGGKVRSE